MSYDVTYHLDELHIINNDSSFWNVVVVKSVKHDMGREKREWYVQTLRFGFENKFSLFACLAWNVTDARFAGDFETKWTE